ncbi:MULTISPECIES: AlpA family transcriptional regulator [Endozoicomonas]|uniref:helix-turn-helix transcriptional regulator n=1 Tax=Endozoicomonas TaxID=305899 RepID=UPI0015809B76|nr:MULTISPECIES: helix-turn-helix domain-containing protein [Endozoicomonas]USE34720.1 helix-turn-helix domain-containing protein [Endozoicomonas sp. SCSIO W0465]
MEVKAPIECINYSTREAAMFIGVCKSALDKSRVSGELFGQTPPPFIKLGRSIRYRVEDLKAWVDHQQTYENLAEAEAEKKFGQNPN